MLCWCHVESYWCDVGVMLVLCLCYVGVSTGMIVSHSSWVGEETSPQCNQVHSDVNGWGHRFATGFKAVAHMASAAFGVQSVERV